MMSESALFQKTTKSSRPKLDQDSRERALLTEIVGFPARRRKLEALGVTITSEALDKRLPHWERSTPVLQTPYASLAIRRMGLIDCCVYFELSPQNFQRLMRSKLGFMPTLRRELWRKLERAGLGTELWLCLKLMEAAEHQTPGYRACVWGCLGLLPGHYYTALRVLRSTADDMWPGSGVVKLEPPKQIVGVALCATKYLDRSRSLLGKPGYTCSRNVMIKAREIYDRLGAKEEVGTAFGRTFVPRPQSLSSKSGSC